MVNMLRSSKIARRSATARVFHPIWLLLLLSLTVGCSKPGPPPVPTYKTTGTVTWKDGSAVQRCIVQFAAASDRSLNISAITDEQGAFELKTLYGNDNLEGAVEGPCTVRITLPIVSADPPTTVQMKKPYEITKGDNHFEIKLGMNQP